MAVAKYEQTLGKRVLGHLASEKLARRGVGVVGGETTNERRVPTISFVVVRCKTGNAISGKDVVKVFYAEGSMGNRYGHRYAYTLADTLNPKVGVNEGLVRISLVHCDTIEEVDRLLEVLYEASEAQ